MHPMLGFDTGWLEKPWEHVGTWQQTLCLIPLFPLVGFAINGLWRKTIGRDVSGLVACAASALAFLWALLTFVALQGSNEDLLRQTYGEWFGAAGFSCSFGLMFDRLSATMTLFITGVGTLIHVYSIGYMSHDPGYSRYFAYLNLFLFSMLVLVLGDNLVLMFVGWEGVGLCSYLLIGFWYEDPAKAAAGMKAFVFNRIGDLGFLLGIFTLVAVFGTVSYTALDIEASGSPRIRYHKTERTDEVSIERPGLLDYAEGLGGLRDRLGQPAGTKLANEQLTVDLRGTLAGEVFEGWSLQMVIAFACLMLFLGACGKSAQIPLYAWLPDAMAGPTPVSALIHAATMVTAGVYMVSRLFPLFFLSEEAKGAVALVGAVTAIFAALIALTQTDIKKVLAYSTVSQLGYMFLGVGAGAWSLGMFHVVTHAFFKALLFLGAGSVIHALSGEQDLRKMGGLRKRLPITYVTMLIGALALSGVPGTSGWFSKDAVLGAVLERAHAASRYPYAWYALYALAVIAAFCTAFYTFRLIFLAFFGEERMTDEAKAHVRESPLTMTIPLVVLAVLAAMGGVVWGWWMPVSDFLQGGHAEGHAGALHYVNLGLTFVAAAAGIAWAWRTYLQRKVVPDPEASRCPLIKWSWNKFYIDDAIYTRFVGGLFAVGSEVLYLLVDVLLIDTLLVHGIGGMAKLGGRFLRGLQAGLMNAYALGILGGAIVVLYWLLRG